MVIPTTCTCTCRCIHNIMYIVCTCTCTCIHTIMYIVHVYVHCTYTCIIYKCTIYKVHVQCTYLDLSVMNGVFSKARSVKGHPVLVIVQVHCLYPACKEPTLTLSVQPCCDREEREREGEEGGIHRHVHVHESTCV